MSMNPRLLRPFRTRQPVNASLLLNFDGDLNDASPNHLTATAQGNAVVSTAQSKWGGSSLYLDGSSTVTIPYDGTFDFGNGNFTIEAWVRPSSPDPSAPYGLVCGGGFPGGWAVYTGGGGNESQTSLNTGSPYWSGNVLGPSPADEVWSHIAFTKQGTLCRCYINGVLNGTVTISGSFNSNNEPLTIGSDRTEDGYKFVGYIDDLRITKACLYCGPFTPPTAPLTPTVLPPICPPPPPPSCDPYGTFLREECQGPDRVNVYADGECGEYSEVASAGGCE
jgi:Concanavalin A-like lectin/glucanases superfamily